MNPGGPFFAGSPAEGSPSIRDLQVSELFFSTACIWNGLANESGGKLEPWDRTNDRHAPNAGPPLFWRRLPVARAGVRSPARSAKRGIHSNPSRLRGGSEAASCSRRSDTASEKPARQIPLPL
jgi:hypothetical protein